jgi:very-short-patch-repair endonuclease
MDAKSKYDTYEANLLMESLQKRGIKVEKEYFTGHMHVDLYLPEAKINVEVDGLQHLTDPEQISRDFNREYHSERHGYHTLHIPNPLVREHLDQIVDAVEKVVFKTKQDQIKSRLKSHF